MTRCFACCDTGVSFTNAAMTQHTQYVNLSKQQ